MKEPYDAWLKSSHHAVATCNDCHVSHRTVFSAIFSKSSSGLRHGVAFTTDEFARPIRLHPGSRMVVEENCARCHREMVQVVRGAAGEKPCGDEGCARCHRQAGHGAQR
jgi:cytochrome c nitrite reductase small subunit